MTKKSGILLHPTSLPSEYGIGDLGREAYSFLDHLKETKQAYWQILPLTPPDDLNSPYQCFSAFAGNPLLISPNLLVEEGLLKKEDLVPIPSYPQDKVAFDVVIPYKERLFKRAYHTFLKRGEEEEYKDFLENHKEWLMSYSLFMALKNHFHKKSWREWPKEIALREERAIGKCREELQEEVGYHSFLQYLFFTQWQGVREYADRLGIEILGDLPIFVAYESSDVWENPHLFTLHEEGGPKYVAGVPPDYFSKTGQRWGNPLYQWKRMKKDDYHWWRRRISHLLSQVHIIRIDHFRGFEAYWEIPAEEKTAVKGQWVKGPGEDFFKTVEKYLGELPVIAEDLGFITREVKELRKNLGYPGMKVLQFAIEGGREELEKVLAEDDIVLYTGTHDNNTILGWYQEALKKDRASIKIAREELGLEVEMEDQEICWTFIEETLKGKAPICIFPIQDILALGAKHKMNTPGTLYGNWAFRYCKKDLTEERIERLKKITEKYTSS